MTTTTAERVPAPYTPEHTPTFTLERQIAEWRAETPLARQALLEAEWQAGVRETQAAEVERIRVKHGRHSPQFRRAAIRLAGINPAMLEIG